MEEKRAQKAKSAEEKAAAKQERAAEKDKKAEEKRVAKEDERKWREKATMTGQEEVSSAAGRPSTAQDEPAAVPRATAHEDPTWATSPTSPSKAGSKGLTGLFSKLKRRSKHNPAASESGFVGGASLRNSESKSHSNQEGSGSSPVPNHIPNMDASGDARDGGHSDVSSLSSDSTRGRHLERTATQESRVSGLSEYEEARDTFNENLAPPPSFGTDLNTRTSGSPARETRFREVL